MLTLSNGQVTLALPDALEWVDEFGWSPVVSTRSYTTTGALLVEEAIRQAGRPITLRGQVQRTWMSRAQLKQVLAWSQVAGLVLTLVLRNVSRSVVFDHADVAVEGVPVQFFSDSAVDDLDWYVPTFRFVEV